ncbi:MAG TPA: SusE domain-containing protein [Flavobacterium sp.]|nr:SusE domain-containing protein [Flavobacterium sp.]
MKKILKISSLAFLLITGLACENDDQTIALPSGGPQLLAPAGASSFQLLPQNAANAVTTLVWNHADYSVQTAVNYKVEVARGGTNFATIFSGGTTTQRFLVWTVEALNSVALQAGLTPFAAGQLDIRIKSSLGDNNVLEAYSNVITINVTPYTTSLPKLYMVGSFLQASGYGSNWTAANGVPLAASAFGATDFEGYVNINDASAQFKFLPTNTNFDGDYGDTGASDGSYSGTIEQTGEVNAGLPAGQTAGYYRVQVNTNTLTYNLAKTEWGIIGNATPGGWDNSTPMTYDPTTKKWTVIAVMTAQSAPDNGWKFRANNGWDINLGNTTVNSTTGTLRYGGDNIGIATAGTYKIELDLSNPRAYTYTITPQ